MNPRQRFLVILLLAVVILGGVGFVGWRFIIKPMNDKADQIAKLKKENDDKDIKVLKIMQDVRKLDVWTKESLPADVVTARREYEKFLGEMFRASDFAPGTFTIKSNNVDEKNSPKLPNKQPIYTKLNFSVTASSSLESLTKMMRSFYTSGLLHQIHNVKVSRPATLRKDQKPRDLDITLDIEALVINNGDKRPFLVPTSRLSAALDLLSARDRSVAGLTTAIMAVSPGGAWAPSKLAPGSRNYDSLTAKNMFLGPPPAPYVPPTTTDTEVKVDTEGLKWVFLTDITTLNDPASILNRTKTEAHLYDRLTNKSSRLTTKAGFNSFRFGDIEKPMVKGEVLKIDEREIYFKASDKFYVIRMGQSIADSMKAALPSDKVKELTGGMTDVVKPAVEATKE